jgi:hypothetical protein
LGNKKNILHNKARYNKKHTTNEANSDKISQISGQTNEISKHQKILEAVDEKLKSKFTTMMRVFSCCCLSIIFLISYFWMEERRNIFEVENYFLITKLDMNIAFNHLSLIYSTLTQLKLHKEGFSTLDLSEELLESNYKTRLRFHTDQIQIKSAEILENSIAIQNSTIYDRLVGS